MKEEQNTNTKTEIVQNAGTETEVLQPDQIYKNNIYALVDDVKNEPQFINKTDEELKQDKSFFPILVDYIYQSYIGDLLGNKNNRVMVYKDIKQLDYLFNIYTSLVYKYKWNNRPLIVEYSLFTGINRDTFYNWVNGNTDNNYNNASSGDNSESLTHERIDTVRKWISTCERALIDGNDTIKDIFILKSKHGYRDNNNDINITVNHKQVISADDLPALIDIKNG